jgi:hypothetical protein
VPTTTEITVVMLAMIRLFFNARMSGAFAQSSSYHFSVKPSHTTFRREVLNEYATRTRIGA